MAQPTPTHNRRFMVSMRKEASFGAGVAVDGALSMNDDVFPDYDPNIVTDENKVAADDGMSSTYLASEMHGLPYAIDLLRPYELGFLAANLLGKVTTSSPPVNTGAPNTPVAATDIKKHVFVPNDGYDLPSFQMEIEKKPSGAAEEQEVLKGGYVNDLSLEMNQGGDRTVRGSGQMGFKTRANTGGTGDVGASLAEEYLDGASGAVWLGKTHHADAGGAAGTWKFDGTDKAGSGISDFLKPGGNSTQPDFTENASGTTAFPNVSNLVYQARLNCGNNVNGDSLYRPGGGKNISVLRRLQRTRTLSLDFEYDKATIDGYDLIRKQTDLGFQWNIVGPEHKTDIGHYEGMSVIIPRMRFRDWSETDNNEVGGCTAEFNILNDRSGANNANQFSYLYIVVWTAVVPAYL